jgi:hypothetical protein
MVKGFVSPTAPHLEVQVKVSEVRTNERYRSHDHNTNCPSKMNLLLVALLSVALMAAFFVQESSGFIVGRVQIPRPFTTALLMSKGKDQGPKKKKEAEKKDPASQRKAIPQDPTADANGDKTKKGKK